MLTLGTTQVTLSTVRAANGIFSAVQILNEKTATPRSTVKKEAAATGTPKTAGSSEIPDFEAFILLRLGTTQEQAISAPTASLAETATGISIAETRVSGTLAARESRRKSEGHANVQTATRLAFGSRGKQAAAAQPVERKLGIVAGYPAAADVKEKAKTVSTSKPI